MLCACKRHFDARGIQGYDTGQFFTLNGGTLPLLGKMAVGTGDMAGAGFGGGSCGCRLQLLLVSELEGAAFPSAPYRPPWFFRHWRQRTEAHGSPPAWAHLFLPGKPGCRGRRCTSRHAEKVQTGRMLVFRNQDPLPGLHTGQGWPEGKREVLPGRRKRARFLLSSRPEPSLAWSALRKRRRSLRQPEA